MRNLLFLLCLLLPLFVSAQRLSTSTRQSALKYVFPLTEKDARILFTKGMHRFNESMLKEPVDSFPSDLPYIPSLPPGQYILAYVRENMLVTGLMQQSPLLPLFVQEGKRTTIVLTDELGAFLEQATVSKGARHARYDTELKGYSMGKLRGRRNISVMQDGKTYYFKAGENRRKWEPGAFKKVKALFRGKDRYYSYFYNSVPHEKKHRGYTMFSKPWYRPGDTLHLKAFVTSRKGKPLNKPLLVRMTDRYFNTDTILATIHPYRKGGYTFDMAIPAAAHLPYDLDQEYLVTLEHPESAKYDVNNYDGDLDEDDYAAKRKVVVRGRFRLEEYELGSFSFKARSSVVKHLHKDPVALFLKAVDENDLPAQDGKVRITVVPGKPYDWHRSAVFIPDTLLDKTIPLENIGETKFVLPDSIFPAASFYYKVHCAFTSADNESYSQTLSLEHRYLPDPVVFSRDGDMLRIAADSSFQIRDSVLLRSYGNGRLLLSEKILLPFATMIRPAVSDYIVIYQGKEYTYRTSAAQPVSDLARTADSVFARVTIPGKHPFWYRVFRGKKTVASGYTDSLWFAVKDRSDALYRVQVHYFWQGRISRTSYNIPIYRKNLVVKAEHPVVAYPGQEVKVRVNVSDLRGMPVENADVSASSYTSRFPVTSGLSMPYFGKLFKVPVTRGTAGLFPFSSRERLELLNWEKWSREMKLDSIAYYRFLYSDTLWKSAEAARDATTQFAPFVTEAGGIVPIELIYIDEVPVYFSRAANLSGYSFRASPGSHNIKLRTSHQLIELKKLYLEPGKKTFIGVNTSLKDSMVVITKQQPRLTEREKLNLARYMILLDHRFVGKFVYVNTPGRLHLLQAGDIGGVSSLVGPLTSPFSSLVVKGAFVQDFRPEGGYRFDISQGLIKQRRDSGKPIFSDKLNGPGRTYDFADLALDEEEVTRRWKQYLDKKAARTTFHYSSRSPGPGSGRLVVHINTDRTAHVGEARNVLLFKESDPSFIRVFAAGTTDFEELDTATYRLYYLFEGDGYVLKNDLHVRKGGVSFYQFSPDSIHAADPQSRAAAAMLREKVDAPDRTFRNADLSGIRDSVNSRIVDISSFTQRAYGAVLDAKSRKPLEGVYIWVKGTSHGVLTAADGTFSLSVPAGGILVASMLGYDVAEAKVADGEHLFYLVPGSFSLDEVVVVGYGVQKKSGVTGSVSVVNSLEGRLAGVVAGSSGSLRLRGINTIQADKPLIIVDGVPYSGDLSSLDTSLLKNMRILKEEEATAIYGAAAAGGVIILSSGDAGEEGAFEDVQDVAASLRKNFRDDAFWQPGLTTDKEGNTFFSVVLPDDVTSWKNRFAVMGPGKKTGYAETTIRSFKALSARLSAPVFFTQGDSVQVLGKTLNYGNDTVTVRNTFLKEGTPARELVREIAGSIIDTFAFAVTEKDSVRLKYMLQRTNGYFDGEERAIPVFRAGVDETRGLFAVLRKDTSIVLDPSLFDGPFKVYAEASPLPAMLEELRYLKEYRYLCNEQVASRLKALLLEKEARKMLKQAFSGDRLITGCIDKLNKSKSKNGLWGWWPGNDPEMWISVHVAEALLMAEKNGYKASLNRERLKDCLVESLEKESMPDRYRALNVLRMLDAKVDYRKYLLNDTTGFTGRQARLYKLEAMQAAGIPVNTDSLFAARSETVFGNYFWGRDSVSLQWSDVQETLSVYRLLRNAAYPDSILERIRYFFLEKRRSGTWANTYESACILTTILPDILELSGEQQGLRLQITGGAQKEVSSFPYSDSLRPQGPVTISKKGTGPVYFTAHRQSWNDDPGKEEGLFSVITSFHNSAGKVEYLEGGRKTVLEAKVFVKKDAEYVMIEIPVPSGCSYAAKPQGWWGNEAHREYFKEKVSIFCRSLPRGMHTFSVELLPRFSGVYRLNPARAEMMYFPLFYGREGMKQVKIR